MRLRPFFCAALVTAASTFGVSAQPIYTWNNTTSGWNTPSAWSPNGVPGGNTGDTAQFLTPIGATFNSPVLNSSQSLFQLNFGAAASNGWTLTGSGALTLSGSSGAGGAGSISQAGLVTRAGSGTTSINLGSGTGTSLTVLGATNSAGGAINVGSSSTLVLTGNTIATTTAANMPISIRGGTLVLDNSAGNPSGQRLTTSNAINLNGGGSTLELRGAAGGTSFTGMTGALGSAGSGDTYVRTVQNGTGALSVNFGSMSRVNTAGNMFFENIGTGFVGDSGNPSVTITQAAETGTGSASTGRYKLFQGVISTSGSTAIPWAAVTSRSTATSNDVTGRWANYNGGIVAATTTSFTGDFGGATAGTNVLYKPTSAGTVNQGVTGNQLASVVFEPGVSGATYNIGAGNQINTLAVLLSGANDFTVTGGSLFSTSASGTRALAVVNPTSALITNSNLAANASPVTISGPGFVILTSTTNQVAFSSTQSFNLGGGTLRVTSTNFDLTTAAAPTLRFRGGVIEYDVSGGSFTFNRSLGISAGNVNWTTTAGFGATNNAGSGGFSAYAGAGNGNGNTLFVNLNGGSTLYWNDQANTNPQLFVTDGYALKFGSLRSNATVNFQNNIALDGSSSTELPNNVSNTVLFNRTREINVTRGVGNAADRTIISGVISGTASSDLVKTGTGVLELAGNNTYQGATIVQGGELQVTGQIGSVNPAGNVFVGSGATLSGSGTITQATGNSTTVFSGGTIRGDSGAGTGTLAVTSVTVQSGGRLGVQLGSGSAASRLNTSAGVLNLNSGAIIDPNGSFDGYGSRVLATLAPGGGGLVVGGVTYNSAADIASYTYQTGDTGLKTFGALQLDVTGLNLANGDQLVLSRNGSNQLVLSLTPVPEPAALLAVCGLVVGGMVAVRRLRRKGNMQLAV